MKRRHCCHDEVDYFHITARPQVSYSQQFTNNLFLFFYRYSSAQRSSMSIFLSINFVIDFYSVTSALLSQYRNFFDFQILLFQEKM